MESPSDVGRHLLGPNLGNRGERRNREAPTWQEFGWTNIKTRRGSYWEAHAFCEVAVRRRSGGVSCDRGRQPHCRPTKLWVEELYDWVAQLKEQRTLETEGPVS